MFIAKAATPEAEEAIPELWGKVFWVSILKWYSFKNGQYFSILSKNFWIFGLKSSFGFPSKSKSNEKLLFSDFLTT